MAEQDRTTEDTRRRRPDLLTLVAGLGTLLVSSYVLSDGAIWVRDLNPTWLLAGGALLVGILMLASSLRGGGRDR